MSLLVLSTTDTMLICGYIVFFMGMNMVAYMISSFYRRKFERQAPSISFILSLIFSTVFLFLFLTGVIKDPAIGVISVFSLLGSGVLSAVSMVSLYFIMRSVRK